MLRVTKFLKAKPNKSDKDNHKVIAKFIFKKLVVKLLKIIQIHIIPYFYKNLHRHNLHVEELSKSPLLLNV